MNENNDYIQIDREDYENLLELQTRVMVLYDLMVADQYLWQEDIFRILGYTGTANHLKDERDKAMAEWAKAQENK